MFFMYFYVLCPRFVPLDSINFQRNVFFQKKSAPISHVFFQKKGYEKERISSNKLKLIMNNCILCLNKTLKKNSVDITEEDECGSSVEQVLMQHFWFYDVSFLIICTFMANNKKFRKSSYKS